jgi:hypothetical protein
MHQLDLPVKARTGLAGQQVQAQRYALTQRRGVVMAGRDEPSGLLAGEARKHRGEVRVQIEFSERLRCCMTDGFVEVICCSLQSLARGWQKLRPIVDKTM